MTRSCWNWPPRLRKKLNVASMKMTVAEIAVVATGNAKTAITAPDHAIAKIKMTHRRAKVAEFPLHRMMVVMLLKLMLRQLGKAVVQRPHLRLKPTTHRRLQPEEPLLVHLRLNRPKKRKNKPRLLRRAERPLLRQLRPRQQENRQQQQLRPRLKQTVTLRKTVMTETSLRQDHQHDVARYHPQPNPGLTKRKTMRRKKETIRHRPPAKNPLKNHRLWVRRHRLRVKPHREETSGTAWLASTRRTETNKRSWPRNET